MSSWVFFYVSLYGLSLNSPLRWAPGRRTRWGIFFSTCLLYKSDIVMTKDFLRGFPSETTSTCRQKKKKKKKDVLIIFLSICFYRLWVDRFILLCHWTRWKLESKNYILGRTLKLILNIKDSIQGDRCSPIVSRASIPKTEPASLLLPFSLPPKQYLYKARRTDANRRSHKKQSHAGSVNPCGNTPVPLREEREREGGGEREWDPRARNYGL